MTKNLNIGPEVKTESQLYAALLEQNRGITFGENHHSSKSIDEMINNMGMFKQKGVDTIYIEGSSGLYTESMKDLEYGRDTIRAYLKNPHDPKLKDMDDIFREQAKSYNGQLSKIDCAQHMEKFYELKISAKQNGIRVYGMDADEKEMKREGEALIKDEKSAAKDRVARMNDTWVSNVEHDRQHQHGRFVVLGGASHFMSTTYGNGLVDDKLGTPVIMPTKSLTQGHFYKGHKEGEADFYIPNGLHETNEKRLYKKPETADRHSEIEAAARQLHKAGVDKPQDVSHGHQAEKPHVSNPQTKSPQISPN